MGVSPTNSKKTPMLKQTTLRPKNKREMNKADKGHPKGEPRGKVQRSVETKSLTPKEKQIGRLDLSAYEPFEPGHRSSVDLSKEETCKGAPGVTCGLPVGDDDEGVACDLCHRWYHGTCQGVTSEAYEALQEHQDMLAWICKECKVKIRLDKNKEKEMKKLEEKIDALTDTIKDQMRVIKKTADDHEQVLVQLGELQGRNLNTLHEQNETIINKVESLAVSSIGEVRDSEKTYADAAKQTCEKHVEKVVSTLSARLDVIPKVDKIVEDIKKVMKTKDTEDRATNILIHNVPESRSENSEQQREDDLKKVKNITEALGVANISIKSILRLRRHPRKSDTAARGSDQTESRENKQNKPRIMLLKLGTKEEAEVLYKRRFDLKRKGIENTYISRDLDPEQREKQRKLREEWNKKGRETHVIYHGKVVERKGNKSVK
ncbi:uncharacterized protein LOC122368937 [Amphibalanus amphitrite]|uniref:uncharacterized protein LOC122368937 n=1 Tax=Amphibalanus amphitrite TaxID=1232801 RepID=UPI001C8FDACC|nr:uncharacterized protein LOC122368937 [Amphibalanus amphitrite]